MRTAHIFLVKKKLSTSWLTRNIFFSGKSNLRWTGPSLSIASCHWQRDCRLSCNCASIETLPSSVNCKSKQVWEDSFKVTCCDSVSTVSTFASYTFLELPIVSRSQAYCTTLVRSLLAASSKWGDLFCSSFRTPNNSPSTACVSPDLWSTTVLLQCKVTSLKANL